MTRLKATAGPRPATNRPGASTRPLPDRVRIRLRRTSRTDVERWRGGLPPPRLPTSVDRWPSHRAAASLRGRRHRPRTPTPSSRVGLSVPTLSSAGAGAVPPSSIIRNQAESGGIPGAALYQPRQNDHGAPHAPAGNVSLRCSACASRRDAAGARMLLLRTSEPRARQRLVAPTPVGRAAGRVQARLRRCRMTAAVRGSVVAAGIVPSSARGNEDLGSITLTVGGIRRLRRKRPVARLVPPSTATHRRRGSGWSS